MEEKKINPEDISDNKELSQSTDELSAPSEEAAAIKTGADEVTAANEDLTPEEVSEPAPDAPAPQNDSQSTAPVYAYRWDYHTQFHEDTAALTAERKRGRSVYVGVFAGVIAAMLTLLLAVLLLGNLFPVATPSEQSLSALYEQCLPSSVAIEGAGSGIILTSDGYIATNYHVIESLGDNITVVLYDGTKYPAQLIDGDSVNDIAVIKIDAKNLTPATLGNSADSKVGDRVMAIGTPLDINYLCSMTSGYISALNRRMVEETGSGLAGRVFSMLQTDTSVNPGNSGGPLFNMRGEVIGVVTMKISGSVVEGLGFAIPIDSVRGILSDIIENGKITNPNSGPAYEGAALGITGFEVEKDTKYLMTEEHHYVVAKDEETGEEIIKIPHMILGTVNVPLSDTQQLAMYGITDYTFMTTEETGVYVFSLTENFDSATKLIIGDIIVKVDGTPCEKMTVLQNEILGKRVGDTLMLTVYRNGKTLDIAVVLGKALDVN